MIWKHLFKLILDLPPYHAQTMTTFRAVIIVAWAIVLASLRRIEPALLMEICTKNSQSQTELIYYVSRNTDSDSLYTLKIDKARLEIYLGIIKVYNHVNFSAKVNSLSGIHFSETI